MIFQEALTPRLFALAAIVLLLAAGGASAQTAPPPGAALVPASSKTLVYFGRWDRSDPNLAHSHWGGAYLRTRFTGTSAWLQMADREDLVVSIDGEPFRPVSGQQGFTALNPAPLPPGLHTLLVGSAAGGEAKVQGLALDPGAVTKPPVPRPIIEFIGDSITWGTGPDHFYNINHAWMAAEALGCDHTQVAQSGRALTTGYGCADPKAGLDKQYFLLKNFGYTAPGSNPPWNFSAYTPQVIVINLGQNDACGNEPDDVFTASYIQFVKNIRAKFPKAQIAALRMFGGGRFGDDTRKAAAALISGGDARVHFIDTEGWIDPKADLYDGVHPNAQGNLKIAMRLVPALKPLLPSSAVAALSPSATVGDPANPTGLAQALQNAYLRGERHIVVTPGTYILTHQGDGAQITLSGWHDAAVSTYKVTMILNNKYSTDRAFKLEGCTNVTLAGPLLSQTSQNAYQGHVLAVGKDAAGTPTCDWRPSAGYPVPSAGTKELWINFVDAKTRTINIRAGDYYHAGIAPLGNGVYRFTLDNRPVQFAVGDWIVARYADPPNKVYLTSCHNCTVKDVTMMRNGFAPIFDAEGGGNHYFQCHWALGPRPAGADEDPLVTNSADGIHSPDDSVGPDIENCTFEGVFLDDCIAIHGGFHSIKSVSGPVVIADNGYAFYAVGEPVRISNDHGFYLQANVTALKDNGNGTSTLTLDTAAAIPTDAKMSNPVGGDGAGYKIIGCRLGNTRSRGIIVKSDNGLIQNNVISHCGLGLRIGPEYGAEADYSQNVIVSGNTFLDNGDALVVDGSGVKENKNITIQNNHFAANTGYDVNIAWADGVALSGNTFAAPAALPAGNTQKPPIIVRDSSNIKESGSVIKTPSAYPKPYVSVGTNVDQLTSDRAAK